MKTILCFILCVLIATPVFAQQWFSGIPDALNNTASEDIPRIKSNFDFIWDALSTLDPSLGEFSPTAFSVGKLVFQENCATKPDGVNGSVLVCGGNQPTIWFHSGGEWRTTRYGVSGLTEVVHNESQSGGAVRFIEGPGINLDVEFVDDNGAEIKVTIGAKHGPTQIFHIQAVYPGPVNSPYSGYFGTEFNGTYAMQNDPGETSTVNFQWPVPANQDMTMPMAFYVDSFLPEWLGETTPFGGDNKYARLRLHSDLLSDSPVEVQVDVTGWVRVADNENPYTIAGAVHTVPIVLTAENMALINPGDDVHTFTFATALTGFANSITQTYNVLNIRGEYAVNYVAD